MSNNMMRPCYNPDSFFTQRNQPTSRPNTLVISGQPINNGALFTPGDYNKLLLSTPELDAQLRNYETPSATETFTTEASNIGQNLLDQRAMNDTSANHLNIVNYAELKPRSYSDLETGTHTEENALPYSSYQLPILPQSTDGTMLTRVYDYESSNSVEDSLSSSSYRQNSITIKEESQYVPSVSNVNEDLAKREKKRERNRQAAQKCRTNKLRRIAELQHQVDELTGKNGQLVKVAENLQMDIQRLEQQLQDHHSQGCTLNGVPML